MKTSQIIILLLLLFISPAISLAQDSNSINLLSYNIRYDNPRDTVNAWERRKDEIAGMVKFHQIHLFGVQEALPHQLKDLKDLLPGFDWVGVGRDDGKNKGEFSAIFYQPAFFDLQESGTFWLSETPEEPSKAWDAALPRICTWAKMEIKDSGNSFYIFNTHFDHVGEQARINSAKLIMGKIAEMAAGEPVVLMGDFNVQPGSEVYQTITEDTPLKDAMSVSASGHYGAEGSYNGFNFQEIPKRRIDFIFVNDQVDVVRHGILTDSYDLKYPSDHLPVLTEVIIGAENKENNPWKAEFDWFEQEDQAGLPAKKDLILFTGSSSIRFWDSLSKDFNGFNVLNRGFGGSQIDDLLLHTERVIFKYQPATLVIYSGDNDISSGKTPQKVLEDYKALVDKVKGQIPDATFIIINIKPSPSRFDKIDEIREANSLIKEWANKQKDVQIADIASVMVDKEGRPLEGFYLEDNLHLNEKGYELWKNILMPLLKK